ncbi:MAG TPA: VOC family protein [Anaerolineales bacterium]|nr:VOC family protein [Anaerolineales bacterium]
MASLYPSWIEIPVADFDRALAFYRAVFELTDTPLYEDEPSMQIAVLLPSDKSTRAPGVSLVRSPQHNPGGGGVQVNFHVDKHAALERALETARRRGGVVLNPIVDMGDGVHYVTLRDSEGNPIAFSSYEPLEGENE